MSNLLDRVARKLQELSNIDASAPPGWSNACKDKENQRNVNNLANVNLYDQPAYAITRKLDSGDAFYLDMSPPTKFGTIKHVSPQLLLAEAPSSLAKVVRSTESKPGEPSPLLMVRGLKEPVQRTPFSVLQTSNHVPIRAATAPSSASSTPEPSQRIIARRVVPSGKSNVPQRPQKNCRRRKGSRTGSSRARRGSSTSRSLSQAPKPSRRRLPKLSQNPSSNSSLNSVVFSNSLPPSPCQNARFGKSISLPPSPSKVTRPFPPKTQSMPPSPAKNAHCSSSLSLSPSRDTHRGIGSQVRSYSLPPSPSKCSRICNQSPLKRRIAFANNVDDGVGPITNNLKVTRPKLQVSELASVAAVAIVVANKAAQSAATHAEQAGAFVQTAEACAAAAAAAAASAAALLAVAQAEAASRAAAEASRQSKEAIPVGEKAIALAAARRALREASQMEEDMITFEDNLYDTTHARINLLNNLSSFARYKDVLRLNRAAMKQ